MDGFVPRKNMKQGADSVFQVLNVSPQKQKFPPPQEKKRQQPHHSVCSLKA